MSSTIVRSVHVTPTGIISVPKLSISMFVLSTKISTSFSFRLEFYSRTVPTFLPSPLLSLLLMQCVRPCIIPCQYLPSLCTI